MDKGAIISECGQYRYRLWRIWDTTKPMVMFVMLNPSTADGEEDDPTIRRCISFANSWGYGGLVVCNLFAYRATNPRDLLKVNDPIGELNVMQTKVVFDSVEKIVCAWGNEPIIKKWNGVNIAIHYLLNGQLDKLHYIELTKGGTPKHPLYLKSNLKPKLWNTKLISYLMK